MKIGDGYEWKLGRFYCWLTIKGPERGIRFGRRRAEHTEAEEYYAISQRVAKGKQKHPLDMTYRERREVVQKLTRKMKWSPGFVETATTPLALRSLEAGGQVRDPLTGSLFGVGVEPGFDHVAGMTRADFIADRAKWKRNAPLFVSSVTDSSNKPSPLGGYEDL